MLHKMVYFIDGAQTKDNFYLLFSLPHCFALWPFFLATLLLLLSLTPPLVSATFNVSLSLVPLPLLRAVSRA